MTAIDLFCGAGGADVGRAGEKRPGARPAGPRWSWECQLRFPECESELT